jgi:hypothetical protein
MWFRSCSMGAASVIKAMMRLSAPQLGQTSGRDWSSRAVDVDVGREQHQVVDLVQIDRLLTRRNRLQRQIVHGPEHDCGAAAVGEQLQPLHPRSRR